MGRKALFGYALHLSIASSLVLKPPQSLPESTSNLPSDPDTSSNSSMTQTVPITSKSSPFSIPNAKSSLSFANITTLANNATLTEMAVSCGDPFPRPGLASFASCKDAWEYIPSDVFIRTFGDRASGFWSVTLPQRFMSGERAPSQTSF